MKQIGLFLVTFLGALVLLFALFALREWETAAVWGMSMFFGLVLWMTWYFYIQDNPL